MLVRSEHSRSWHAPETSAYVDEGALQRLIADSPSLLPGVEDALAAVALELPVPKTGAADVVVVSAKGEITIVECKLAANPEIRRKVIGQAFSYAAGLWQLTYEELAQAFASRGSDLNAAFKDAAGWDAAVFREAVAANLERGAFRLIIAVDHITEELKRTVLFINRHTTPELRLLALELRHASDSGVEILLPEVYGEESADERAPAGKRLWDEDSLIEGIRDSQDSEHAHRLVRLYEFLRDAGARRSWGKGATPSVTMWLGEDVDNPVAVGFYAAGPNWPGGIVVYFDFVRERRTPREMGRLAELLRQVPGVASYLEGLEEKNWGMHGGMEPMRVLASDEALAAWQHALVEATKSPRP